jgi:hypothetical protein
LHWTGLYSTLGNLEEACRSRLICFNTATSGRCLFRTSRNCCALRCRRPRCCPTRYTEQSDTDTKTFPGSSLHHGLSNAHTHHGGLITAGVNASILFQCFLRLASRHSGLLCIRINACTTQFQLQRPLNDEEDQDQDQDRRRLLLIEANERLLANRQFGRRPLPELPH